MKRKIFNILVLTLTLLYTTDVYASTNTYERTNDNLLVPDYIEVNEDNISNILQTPAVDSKEKVYDFADLFTDSEENSLYDKVSSYISATDMDMAIVTINNNEKGDASVYADDFYDYNNFGIGSSHDGLLFLIDMDNREIYISTTGSAISIYSNYNKILDYVISYMSYGNYYDGCSSFINLATSYASISTSDSSKYTINSNGELVKDNRYLIAILIFAFVGTAIIIIIMVRMNKMVFKAASSKEYLNKDTKRVNVVNDVFLGSHVSKIRIDNDNSSGGGGIHTGSGGISHGGGGHKF